MVRANLEPCLRRPKRLNATAARAPVVPQQALALTNSELVHQVSDRVAAALWRSPRRSAAPTAEGFIVAAFEHVLSRTPSDAERKRACVFFRLAAPAIMTTKTPSCDPGWFGRFINHNDFITIR